MKKQLSNEEKQAIIKRYQNGETATNLSRKFNVSTASIYNWVKKANKNLSSDQNINSLHQLNKSLKKLTDIIEIKNQVNCNNLSPLKEKLYELEKLNGKYSVYSLCEALNVDRATYYNHINRNKKKNTVFTRRREEMKKIILDVYNESNQIFGAKKIVFALKEQGVKTSITYVYSIMKELGIKSISLNSKKTHISLSAVRKEDKVKMNFETNSPNEVWVSDTTSFKIKNKPYYICAIIDLFSRKVISYKISPKHSTNLVISTFKLAYNNREVEKLIFHSDRGSQFTSNTFMKLLSSLNITQSFSPTASPYHNAVIESFFAYLKREEIYRKEYRSYNHFKCEIDKYIIFFNSKRPHSYLNHKTPDKFEELYYNF